MRRADGWVCRQEGQPPPLPPPPPSCRLHRRRPPAACTCVPERSLAGFCREQCDVAVASIYVNPTQFSKNEDFGVYPRSEARCVLS